MLLFIRLFARYAAYVGYLDGKRNYPKETDYIEMPVYGVKAKQEDTKVNSDELLKISDITALKEWR